jgi:hypothetical protein
MPQLQKFPAILWLFLLFSALIGLLTTWKTRQILQRSYPSDLHLEASQSPDVQLHFTLTLTELTTNPNDDHTEVQVQVNHSSLKELELQFPFTDGAEVERAIAQELGVSPAVVQALRK